MAQIQAILVIQGKINPHNNQILSFLLPRASFKWINKTCWGLQNLKQV